MTAPTPTPSREDYGIDAPTVVRNNVLIGLLLCLVALGMLFLPVSLFGDWGATAILVLFFAGFSLLLTSGVMVYGSRVGKLRLRDRLLNQLPWRGDERVLDVGCGRGVLQS